MSAAPSVWRLLFVASAGTGVFAVAAGLIALGAHAYLSAVLGFGAAVGPLLLCSVRGYYGDFGRRGRPPTWTARGMQLLEFAAAIVILLLAFKALPIPKR